MLVPLVRFALRPYRAALLLVGLLQLGSTLALLFLPSLNADIVDQGVARGDTGEIVRTGGFMLAVSFGQILAAALAVWLAAGIASGVGRDLRREVYQRVVSFSSEEVARFGAPSLITRCTNDVQQVQMLVLLALTMLLAAPLMLLGGLVMAMREDLGLSWLLAVCVPTLIVVVGWLVRGMVPGFRRLQVQLDAVNRVLREQITGIRVVRAFVRETHEQQRFEVANAELTRTSLLAGRRMAAMFPAVLLVMNLSIVGVFWFGAHRIDSGAMGVGALIAFMSYLLQILMSVMMATFMLVQVPRASACADRICEVLETETTVLPPQEPGWLSDPEGVVAFDAVSFAYPGAAAPVLVDVSFTARPGEVVAIVGSTGSGKTTLVELVPRLHDVTWGAVRLDGTDVRELDLEHLWSLIGLVPQSPFLFSGTIRTNLLHGRARADDAELWEALEVAQAADFVRALPDGLDSPVEQGGANFSGGQRQRLSIARAVVRRPKVLILDDAFSALDLTTDSRLRKALRDVTASTAVIAVAQRVSSIVDADRIVVLEDGRQVGDGTHASLLASCPAYQEIVDSQLAAGSAR